MHRSAVLVVLLALVAGCPDPVPARDAAPDPDAAPAAPAPAALVVSAGGTVSSATYTLDLQVGEAMLPRPVSAGDTTLAPSSAIHH
jgi:hypothetical protein